MTVVQNSIELIFCFKSEPFSHKKTFNLNGKKWNSQLPSIDMNIFFVCTQTIFIEWVTRESNKK